MRKLAPRTQHILEKIGMTCAIVFFVWAGVHSTPARVRIGYGQTDLAVFVTAGSTMTSKIHLDPPQIYDTQAFKQAVKKIRIFRGGTKFFYPPQAAVLFTPLSLISLPQLTNLWLWLNGLVFVVTYYGVIWLGVRDRLQKIQYSLLLTMLAYAGPVMGLFKTGQINTMIWLLLVGGCLALAYRRQYLSGMALALATAIKIFPVLFVAYFVIKKQWGAVVAFCATSVGLWLTTIPFFGVDGLYRFWQYPFSLLLEGRLNYIYKSVSLYGSFRMLVRSGIFAWTEIPKKVMITNAETVFTALTVGALLGVGYILWKRRKAMDQKTILYEYTLIVCFFLLFSKSIHAQYLFWLLPLLLLWISNIKQHWLFGAGCALLLSTQFYNHFLILHQAALHRMHTLGVVALCTITVLQLIRLRKDDTLK